MWKISSRENIPRDGWPPLNKTGGFNGGIGEGTSPEDHVDIYVFGHCRRIPSHPPEKADAGSWRPLNATVRESLNDSLSIAYVCRVYFSKWRSQKDCSSSSAVLHLSFFSKIIHSAAIMKWHIRHRESIQPNFTNSPTIIRLRAWCLNTRSTYEMCVQRYNEDVLLR